jgi:signal transduction histidine kinase
VRADGVLGDVEACGDLVGAEMLVEKEQDLHLAGAELVGDRVRYAGVEPAAALAYAVDEAARDLAGERSFAVSDTFEELGDPLGRLGLEQVAGRAGANRGKQVLLGARGGEDDDLTSGGRRPDPRQRLQPARAGHGQIEKHEIRLDLAGAGDRFLAVRSLADHGKVVLLEQADERGARQRMIVDDEYAPAHVSLIGRGSSADKRNMRSSRARYLAWVRDELVLVGLLGAALILFLAEPGRRGPYDLPSLRLFLDTAILVVSLIVCVLAYVRFTVDRRTFELYLLCGFFVTAVTTLAFAIAPVLDGGSVGPSEAWAAIAGRLVAVTLIAAAPFTSGRVATNLHAVATIAALTLFLYGLWLLCRIVDAGLPLLAPGHPQPDLLTAAVALQAVLGLVGLVGFGLRYRAHGEDLDRWLAFGATIWLFAELHAVFAAPLSSEYVSQSDFLRLLSYAILLVGVWRAIRAAEFGRVVAEERARVAREIHDGLAQYLFAVSTQTSLLAGGADLDKVLPRLQEAASAAQQEARFAVLALSSAGGSAPFDAALTRYVEFLTADGQLDVDLEIEREVDLRPDEQIEIFRIVQESLANVRRHANARRATVLIGLRDGQRVVRIVDDGDGFDEPTDHRGQGLRNIRSRAAAIGGAFRLVSRPGGGTSLEVVLRA